MSLESEFEEVKQDAAHIILCVVLIGLHMKRHLQFA